MANKNPKDPRAKKTSAKAQKVPNAAEEAIEQAQGAVDAVKAAADDDAASQSLSLPDFGGQADADAGGSPADLALLRDVNLKVKVELGRTRMFVEDVLRLNENSIIELDKLAGDPVDIYVNDRPVARGEVLVVNDNFCVRVSESIRPIEDD